MKVRNNKEISIFILLGLLALIVTGCTPLFGTDASDEEPRNGPAEVTLIPFDVFEGDAAKFKSFLGAMSGAFKLRYEGHKPNARLDIDIWENGKKVSSAGSIHDLFFSTDVQASHEIEVIISIDTDTIQEQEQFIKLKVGTINDPGSSVATFTIPWDKKLSARGLINYSEPRTFIAGEPAYLWGMHATSTNFIHALDFAPESLSRVEGALIFTLHVEE